MRGGAAPAVFEFYLGGSTGPSLYARLADGRLLYEWASAGGYSGEVAEASPTEEEWVRFRDAVDRLGLWGWESEYASAHSCCDVTYWHLRMEMDGQSIVARGADAYPGSSGPEVSKQFREFLAAVKRLIGVP